MIIIQELIIRMITFNELTFTYLSGTYNVLKMIKCIISFNASWYSFQTHMVSNYFDEIAI